MSRMITDDHELDRNQPEHAERDERAHEQQLVRERVEVSAELGPRVRQARDRAVEPSVTPAATKTTSAAP